MTPVLTSDIDLLELWETLMGDFGYDTRSLRFFVIHADGRPHPTLTTLDDLPRRPGPGDPEALIGVLSGVVDPGQRVALLLSRPGRDGVTAEDRLWAGELYAACRRAALPCEVVHRANDAGVLAIPLDDL